MLHLHKNRTDEDYPGEHRAEAETAQETAQENAQENARAAARDKFGGTNTGAAFFGWLVAMGTAILLMGIAGAVVAAVNETTEITQSEAERQAGTIGVGAAIVLLGVLMVGYYAGGYVAGRMSRYDGGRQGVGVWLVGLVVTVVTLGVGAAFGAQYNVLDRVDLPRVPISTEELGWGGTITGVAVVILTLLAAVLGGLAGHRYHNRVDRVLQTAS